MTLRLTRADVRTLVASGRLPVAALPADVRLDLHRGRTRAGCRADLGGLYVRSSWEANRARWLRKLQREGAVLAWAYEPEIFTFPVARGCREYRPDFHVWTPAGDYFEEVKGYWDAKSKTRLRRMRQYYPAVRIEVIGREWFVAMEHTGLAAVCPGWERLA
jgi:hypothetical protein